MYEEALMDAAGWTTEERELIRITWDMLHAIHTGDAETYTRFTAPDLSCFEDVCDHRIDGLEFHLSLISLMRRNSANEPSRFDMLSPRVQLYGDTGIVTYTRLMTYEENGKPRWLSYNESRVYIKRSGDWRMVHFHRTPV